MRFCTMTLGCKVNQYETLALEGILCKQGHELVNLGDGCDVCILNTCAVTVESERKSRQAIRRMKKLEPEAKIAVCGCYSKLKPESVKKAGADYIRGIVNTKLGTVLLTINDEKSTINDEHSTNNVSRTVPNFDELPPGSSINRTRALLKIQDGCDKFCTYCIVPHIRGRSCSLPLERIAEYARQLDKQGYKEIVITGIEISSYGKNLVEAIRIIGAEAPNARLRLGSLDPAMMTNEMCNKLSKISALCNHFHLSLQSGCDKILNEMGRKYTTNQVSQNIEFLRTYFPGCAITADLITGFPGETDEDFNITLDFIKKAAFSDMHIFPYSQRPGTKAADMPNQIEQSIKKERARIATKTAKKMADSYKKTQIGKTLEVLFEQENNGYSKGHSGNYQLVTVKEKLKRNTIHNVTITGIKNDILSGEIS